MIKCLGGPNPSKTNERKSMTKKTLGVHQVFELRTMWLKLTNFWTLIVGWMSEWFSRCWDMQNRFCIISSRKNLKLKNFNATFQSGFAPGKTQNCKTTLTTVQPRSVAADFFLFPQMKFSLKEHHFDILGYLQKNTTRVLNSILAENFCRRGGINWVAESMETILMQEKAILKNIECCKVVFK